MISVPRPSSHRNGFTIVEVLAVVMIMSIILAAGGYQIMGAVTSTRLSTAGEGLQANISYARQLAMSRNDLVELRFYRYIDPEVPGSTEEFRAYAVMRMNAPTTVAAAAGGGGSPEKGDQEGQTIYLPSGIVFGESNALSPLLAGSILSRQSDVERVVKRAQIATYCAIQFLPDGTTNLIGAIPGGYQPSQSYLSLIEETPGRKQTQIPSNFFTVQIDPASGKPSRYRP